MAKDIRSETIEELAARLDVDIDKGLTEQEAVRRLEIHGPNELQEEEEIHPIHIFLDQFKDALIFILMIATLIAFLLWVRDQARGHTEELYPYDAMAITAIIILNAVIGFYQEFKAERAIKALKQLAQSHAVVLRQGDKHRVLSSELVLGDVVFVSEGDRVPADIQLVETHNMRVDESAFTGESVPVSKSVREYLDGDRSPQSRNMLYLTTTVLRGSGKGVVVGIGMDTQIGNIATLLRSTTKDETPLQKNMKDVGKKIGYMVLIISIVVAVAGIMASRTADIETIVLMFTFGVALAVAAIPEGLPAVVTVALGIGVKKMAEQNAIIRKLPAVETLGSTTVICSDKTGTLTKNEMTVQEIVTGQDAFLVTGYGYESAGKLLSSDGKPVGANSDLHQLCIAAVLCNNANLYRKHRRVRVNGDPTEGALLVLSEKLGNNIQKTISKHPRKAEITFSSERKCMSTIHTTDEGYTLFTKGAPEIVLDLCSHWQVNGKPEPMSEDAKNKLLLNVEDMSSRALRTLAIAYRPVANSENVDEETLDATELESGLVFLGLAGMMDPPREEAASSIEKCGEAGIRTIMITGDHKLTAEAIATKIGLSSPGRRVVTGVEIDDMTDLEIDQAVRECDVFARVNPEHKLQIVQILKKQGEIVAMTGDGVNDAPALKAASIGVAMGITGTDVAKEAADMILLDDNFSSIVAAIEEGRGIFQNIRKFILYLLSSNAGEVLTMFFGVMLAVQLGLSHGGKLFLPLLASQLLWINLLTDSAPAVALGVDPPAAGLMQEKPRPATESVISAWMWMIIWFTGTIMCLGSLLALDGFSPGGFIDFETGTSIELGRTMAFTVLVMYQMFHVFNTSAFKKSIFGAGIRNIWLVLAVILSILLQIAVIYFPTLQAAFGTVPLDFAHWVIAIAIGSSIFFALELLKLATRFFESKQRSVVSSKE